jgi:hypothetical protein
MKRGGEEIATKEKRRIKREIARKANSTVMTQSINRAKMTTHHCFNRWHSRPAEVKGCHDIEHASSERQRTRRRATSKTTSFST